MDERVACMHRCEFALCGQSYHEVGLRQDMEEKMRIRVGESAKRRSDCGLCGGGGGSCEGVEQINSEERTQCQWQIGSEK